MKTRISGNYSPSRLICSICFIMLMTASGCASTNIPTTTKEPTNVDPYQYVYKENSHLYVYKGDHILVNTKDDRALQMIVTENNWERRTITGRPLAKRPGRGTVYYEQDNSLGAQTFYESSVDVSFAEIESIEIRDIKHQSYANNEEEPRSSATEPPAVLGLIALIAQLWLGSLMSGLLV